MKKSAGPAGLPSGHLRLQRRVRVCRWCVIRFAKTGPSLSVGGQWLKVNFSRYGIRLTATWPRSGASYYWLWRWTRLGFWRSDR